MHEKFFNLKEILYFVLFLQLVTTQNNFFLKYAKNFSKCCNFEVEVSPRKISQIKKINAFCTLGASNAHAKKK